MRRPNGGDRARAAGAAASAEVVLDEETRRPDDAAAFARAALERWEIGGREDVVDTARRMAAVAPGHPVDLRLEASPVGFRLEVICRADAEGGQALLRDAGLAAPRAGVIGIGPASCAWAELDK